MLDSHESLQQQLGDRYELEDVLGEGGMGTVYLARDRKHDRLVAIKTVRPDLTTEAIRARFEREIRITARLQHPHILPLLDSGIAGRTIFYVMPYLEGESLEARLDRGERLTPNEVIRIGRDVADGLQHAHEQGVIHRDIKPGNILLKDRHAVIVDFGIAKALAEAGGDTLTQTGWSPGSPNYMAPEQFEGGTSAKSDIYTLGLVLHEAATGHRRQTGFEGERDWTGVPPALRSVIERALMFDPRDRWPNAGEFRRALAAQRSRGPTRFVTPRRATVGAIATLAVGAVIVIALVRLQGEASAGARTVVSQRQVTFAGNVVEAAVAPQGDFLAYTTKGADGMKLMVEDLGSGSSIEIAGTRDRFASVDWSPDGRQILVGAFDSVGGATQVYPRLGGDPYSIPTEGLSRWSADGRQVYSWYENQSYVEFFTLASGEYTRFLTADTTAWFSDAAEHPTGHGLAILQVPRGGGSSRIWRLAIDSARRFESKEAGASPRPADEYELLLEDPATLLSIEWSPRGDALYYLRKDQNAYQLWKLPTEADGTGARAPDLVVSGLQLGGIMNESWQSILSSTSDGSQLFIVSGRTTSNLWSMRADGDAWAVQPLTRRTAVNRSPSVSPDGEWLAYKSTVAGRTNVYVMPSEGGTSRQLTRIDSVVGDPVWSPKGRSLAFGIRRGEANRVAITSFADPAGMKVFESTRLSANGTIEWGPGAEVLYQRPGAQNFHFLDADTGAERPLLSADSARLGWPLVARYAPDGRHLAVQWNRYVQSGLYVFALSENTHRRLTPQPASPLGWSADGRSIYAHVSARREVISIPLNGGAPTILNTLPFEPSLVGTAHEGEWFVFDAPESTGDVWRLEDVDSDS